MASENVTVLFSDLVGSTALSSALDPDDADDLRRTHFALLRQAIAASGGAEVKNLGDGLMVVFRSASAGLSCAVAMQQAVEHDNRRAGRALGLRVGLSTGEATREAGDFFGDPVVEASRLCSAAQGGQILVSALVRATAGRRSTLTFRSLGPLELKGLPEPLETLEIAWEPVAVMETSAFPEPFAPTGVHPPRPARLTETPFVGRSAQLAQLQERLDRLVAGAGSVVMLRGEPGIGKTRLLTELATMAVSAGAQVWSGASYEADPIAYGVWREALDSYLRSTNLVNLRTELGDLARVVARISPSIADTMTEPAVPSVALDDLDAHRVRSAVVRLLERAAVRAPVVVILDDLQWADTASIELVRSLARAVHRAPILLAGAYRDVEVDGDIPLLAALAELRRDVDPLFLQLTGLSLNEIEQLAGAILREPPSSAVIDTLAIETVGNPFFIREVVLQLALGGSLSSQDLDAKLPEGVRDVIGRRVTRLSERTREFLTAASGFETPFKLGVVAAVAHLSDDESLDAVDEALDASLLRAAPGLDRYEFDHALFRHTIYSGLSPSRRVRLHLALAEALEKTVTGTPTAEIAAQLLRQFTRSAPLPGAERGVPYAIMVADEAARAYAADEELAALEVATQLLPQGSDRAQLELRLRQASPLYLLGRVPELIGRLTAEQDRVDRVADDALGARWAFWLAHANSVSGNPAQARIHADRALLAATRSGDREILGKTHYVLGVESMWLSRHREGIEHGRLAASMLEGSPQKYWLGMAHWITGINALFVGTFDEALQSLTRCQNIGREIDDSRLMAYAAWSRSWVSALRSQAAAAIREAEEGIGLAHDPYTTWVCRAFLGHAYLEAGDAGAAVGELEPAVKWLSEAGFVRFADWMSAYLASALTAMGDDARAESMANAVAARMGVTGFDYGVGVALRVAAAIAMHENQRVRALATMEAAVFRFNRAEAYFDEARTLEELALIYGASGDVASSTRELQRAFDRLRDLGADEHIERFRERLRTRITTEARGR